MRILFLSHWFPFPSSNGSKLRILNLLKGLVTHHDVTLLSFTEEGDIYQPLDEICALCRDVQIVPKEQFAPQSLKATAGYLSRMPRSVVDTYSRDMAKHIESALAAERYDLIIASQIGTAVYSDLFASVPALFEEIELAVFFERFAQASTARARLRNGLTWHKHRQYLKRLMRNFSVGTVVSVREKELLSLAVPDYKNVEIIPNCVSLEAYADIAEEPEPDTLIFAGSFSYRPNYDAMIWFLREVYPLIQAEVPGVRLTITGDHRNLPLPSSRGVTLTGFVDDVRPYVARSWVSLAPLQVGGGTRLKILEAMALQSPVVATAKGAEGLAVESGKHLLVADSPVAFAEAVVRILQDRALRDQIAENAYRLVGEQYDWKETVPRFLELVQRTAAI
jgi:polysaccharide biosynthesis protein PslH